jgi:hypothetical protein
MNLFRLAEMQLARENKDVTAKSVLDKAIKIRKFIDKNPQLTLDILSGKK